MLKGSRTTDRAGDVGQFIGMGGVAFWDLCVLKMTRVSQKKTDSLPTLFISYFSSTPSECDKTALPPHPSQPTHSDLPESVRSWGRPASRSGKLPKLCASCDEFCQGLLRTLNALRQRLPSSQNPLQYPPIGFIVIHYQDLQTIQIACRSICFLCNRADSVIDMATGAYSRLNTS
jgi:hypothetical protein